MRIMADGRLILCSRCCIIIDIEIMKSRTTAVSLGVVLAGCIISYVIQREPMAAPFREALQGLFASSSTRAPRELTAQTTSNFNVNDCYNRMLRYLGSDGDPFRNLTIALHHNGDASPCFTTADSDDVLDKFKQALTTMDYCPFQYNDKKYQVESFLTRVWHNLSRASCGSPERSNNWDLLGLLGYCDMGIDQTPVLMDHANLIPIQLGASSYLPCHYHLMHGVRITSLSKLAAAARDAPHNKDCDDSTATPDSCRRELHLYAVPAGRMFMFAASQINDIISLPHVTGADPSQPVYLQVLSTSPRVFELFNFLGRNESADLVKIALQEQRDSHRIKRSSTGAQGYAINAHRTSESGYDTSSPTALAIKRRCFETLGFDVYMEEHADGLQVLRYNTSTSYRTHLDYMDGSDALEHDYDSAHKGGNRFATILLYMTDMEPGAGGETVFTKAWPMDTPVEKRLGFPQVRRIVLQSAVGYHTVCTHTTHCFTGSGKTPRKRCRVHV